MSRSTIRLLAASGLCVLLHGCGGGSDEQPAMASAAGVRLEGCVVDQHYVPNEGVPVRVLAADGRLLASATSGRMGEFVVRIPAGAPASMAVDRADGERMPMPALDRDRVADACLVARH